MGLKFAKVATIGIYISILKVIKRRKFSILISIKKLAIFRAVGTLAGKIFYGEVSIKSKDPTLSSITSSH